MKKMLRLYVEKVVVVIKEYILFFLKHYLLVTLLLIGCLATFIYCPILMSEEKYELIKNLMFSYMGAFLFFLLVNYYPERKRAMKCKKQAMPILERIYDDLSYIIALIDYELSKIDQNSGEVSGIIYNDEERFADICYFINDNYIDHVKGWHYRIHTELYKRCKLINEMIDKILTIPCFAYCESEVVVFLSDLRENNFLKRIMFHAEAYKVKKRYGMQNWHIINSEKDETYKKLKDLYKMMAEFIVDKRHYIFYDISNSEVERIKDFFDKTEDLNIETLILQMELNKKYE